MGFVERLIGTQQSNNVFVSVVAVACSRDSFIRVSPRDVATGYPFLF